MKYTKLCRETCIVLTVLLALYQTAAGTPEEEPTTIPPDFATEPPEPSTMPPDEPPTTMDVESSSTTKKTPPGFVGIACLIDAYRHRSNQIRRSCRKWLCSRRHKKIPGVRKKCREIRRRRKAYWKKHHKFNARG